jgi:hypothetical protein
MKILVMNPNAVVISAMKQPQNRAPLGLSLSLMFYCVYYIKHPKSGFWRVWRDSLTKQAKDCHNSSLPNKRNGDSLMEAAAFTKDHRPDNSSF